MPSYLNNKLVGHENATNWTESLQAALHFWNMVVHYHGPVGYNQLWPFVAVSKAEQLSLALATKKAMSKGPTY